MIHRVGQQAPIPDAFRVLTLALAGGGAGSSSSSVSPSTAFQNLVTLWDVAGNDLFQFDADEAGLGAALTAAHDGGAVVLPSKTIALTAAFGVGIGVTLIGLSEENSILSFTGLNNESAITLNTRSVLEHCTVTVDGTQPLVGVDARAAKAAVRHVIVNIASHANNIKIYAGFAESP